MATVNELVSVSKDGVEVIKDLNSSPIIDKKSDTLYLGYDRVDILVGGKKTKRIWLPLEFSFIWASLKDSEQNFYWLGLSRGLGYWNEHLDTVKMFTHFNGFQELGNSTIFHLIQLDNGNVLAATSTGIYEISFELGVLNRYWMQGEPPHYLPIDEFYYIYKDSQDIFWLGSNGGGLIKWEKDLGRYEQFCTANGFPSGILCAIYEDDSNHLWISTYEGLVKFEKGTNDIRIYTTKDGLTHNEFNRGSHFKSSDGKLYFGGLNGVNSFYPKDLVGIPYENDVPLHLVNVYHFNEQTNKLVDKLNLYHESGEIRLRPEEGFVSIEFALLDFENNKNTTYAYQIGDSTEWKTIEKNEIKISGLEYGHYTVRIKGRMGDGGFSSNELVLPLVVMQPFYKEKWFIIGVGVLFIFGMGLFFKWWNRRLITKKIELENLVRIQTFELEKDKAIIEEQKQKLLELDKVKTRFFANVSHELRTPITLIQGPIGHVLKDPSISNGNRKILNKVEKNVESLMGLVNELLDLTKIETGNLALEEREVVLHSFIQRKFSSFESIAKMKEIHFLLDCKICQDLTMLVDEKKMDKILNNLLSNAFKFTPNGGTVHLIVKDFGEDIKIQVKDNGRGISKEDIPFVFNRFYQSPSKGKEKAEGGLGIGLALSLELTKLMKGDLWVESEEGVGTEFFMKFPKKQIEPRELAINKESDDWAVHTKSDALSSKITNDESTEDLILLVEDHLGLQEYIHFVLSPNYRVEIVGNGKEAMEWLDKGFLPNLIISDLMMPVMDGFEFVDNIKQTSQFSHIPIIILTARVEFKDKLKALRIGVDDYLLKPFNEEELKARIKNLISNYKAKREFVTEGQLVAMAGEDAYSIETIDVVSKEDQLWLEHLENVILDEIDHHSFSVGPCGRNTIHYPGQIIQKNKSPNRTYSESVY